MFEGSNLEKLDLDFDDTEITSIDLTHNPALKSIDIDINTMTELILPPASDNLETLSFGDVDSLRAINASGQTGLRELNFLYNMEALTSLDFSNCSSLTKLDISRSMSKLQTLNISGCTSLKSFYLSGEKPIEALDFTGCEFLDKVEIVYNTTISNITLPDVRDLSSLQLDGLHALTELNLGSSNIGYINNHSTPSISSDIPQISSLTGLQTLHLSYATVSNLDLKAMTSLKDIDIRYCNSLGTVDCSGLTNLSHFYLENTPASVLLTNCTGIDSLYVRDCENLNIDGASSLKYLRLVDIDSEAFSEFNLHAPNIEELQIDNCDYLISLNVAEGNKLKKVYLGSNSVLKFKRTELNASSTLEELKINYCSIYQNESTPRDSIGLSGYSALKFADISNNYNYTYVASFEGCTSLTDLRLRNCSPLEHLTLTGCSALHSLDIQSNNLGSEELAAILDILPNRTGSANCLYYISGNPGSNDLSLIQTNIDNAATRGWYQSDNQLEELEFTFDFDYQ